MTKKYFCVACVGLLFGIACHENQQQPLSPANGNILDAPGTRPPRQSPPAGGGTSGSMTDMSPLADAGTGVGGSGGMGGVPIGGAYNTSGIGKDSNNMPPGPQ